MNDPDDRSERDLLDESLSMHIELRPGKTLSQIEEPRAVEEADWPRFRRLTFFSVLAFIILWAWRRRRCSDCAVPSRPSASSSSSRWRWS